NNLSEPRADIIIPVHQRLLQGLI
ncbi:hypothetical protein TNCT_538801, partial [Trichonephila clavata]